MYGSGLRLFLRRLVFGEEAARLLLQLADLLVELVDVAHAVLGQQAQAALHLEHRVAQRVGGLLRDR